MPPSHVPNPYGLVGGRSPLLIPMAFAPVLQATCPDRSLAAKLPRVKFVLINVPWVAVERQRRHVIWPRRHGYFDIRKRQPIGNEKEWGMCCRDGSRPIHEIGRNAGADG